MWKRKEVLILNAEPFFLRGMPEDGEGKFKDGVNSEPQNAGPYHVLCQEGRIKFKVHSMKFLKEFKKILLKRTGFV